MTRSGAVSTQPVVSLTDGASPQGKLTKMEAKRRHRKVNRLF
jgi:hypothetical protein